jgi:Leu/Phe-tRNA-protein transferase
VNPHLVQFGAIEVGRKEYLRLLKSAVEREAVFR